MRILVLKYSIAVLVGLMISETSKGQFSELKEYKWENRLVLINSENEDSANYKNQFNEFYKSFDDLEERKLILILVKRNKYKTISFKKNSKVESDWINTNLLYRKYMKNKGDFRVVLIGLDGSVKLNQKKVLPRLELFRIIDSMPMRQAEIRAKKDS